MKLMQFTKADPDRQIRGWGGGGSSRPGDKGEGAVSKKISLALRALVWSENKGGPPVDLTLPAPCWETLICNTKKLIPSYCAPSPIK